MSKRNRKPAEPTFDASEFFEGPAKIVSNIEPTLYNVITALRKLTSYDGETPGDSTERGREAAYRVLYLYGRGVDAVRNLKPEHYGDVIRGCTIEVERLDLYAKA